MNKTTPYTRINIYLDDPELRIRVKVAAARKGMTVSAYCLEAIRHKLDQDEAGVARLERPVSVPKMTPQEAAEDMDRLREEIGPIGMSLRELIEEGRYR